MNKTFSKKSTIIILIALALLTAGLAYCILVLSQKDNNLNWNTVIKHKGSVVINNVEDENIDTSEWLTYTNEEYGYTYKYPYSGFEDSEGFLGDANWFDVDYTCFNGCLQGDKIQRKYYHKCETEGVYRPVYIIKGESGEDFVAVLHNNRVIRDENKLVEEGQGVSEDEFYKKYK
ncbi:hypothetical protein L6278_02685, partial [Candidatus Parcubacteria bacterium]|nr:hypothetical protein [Candidatus Parcubacteria bacterium]